MASPCNMQLLTFWSIIGLLLWLIGSGQIKYYWICTPSLVMASCVFRLASIVCDTIATVAGLAMPTLLLHVCDLTHDVALVEACQS